MENESATSLYVQACKFLLCGEDRSSWDQLMAILPRLRNALTCRVCRGLIVDPLSSGYCQHYVCRACLKRKRALNPGCKWCLDFSKLKQSDEQVRVVLACYKLLCEAIKSSSYYVENDENLVIANLLREAKLNLDVLPNSNILVSKNSQQMADNWGNIASRDQSIACAREKTDVKTSVNDGGNGIHSVKNGILEDCNEESVEQHQPSAMIVDEEDTNQLRPNAVDIKTDNIKDIDDIDCNNSNSAVTAEGNDQVQSISISVETDDTITNCNGFSSTIASIEETNAEFQPNAIESETDHAKISCNDQPDCKNDRTDSKDKNSSEEINNNGTKTRPASRAKAKSKKVCLRPRNGQLVQKFEPHRHMRKRKPVTQTLNQKGRPRKRCKIGATK